MYSSRGEGLLHEREKNMGKDPGYSEREKERTRREASGVLWRAAQEAAPVHSWTRAKACLPRPRTSTTSARADPIRSARERRARMQLRSSRLASVRHSSLFTASQPLLAASVHLRAAVSPPRTVQAHPGTHARTRNAIHRRKRARTCLTEQVHLRVPDPRPSVVMLHSSFSPGTCATPAARVPRPRTASAQNLASTHRLNVHRPYDYVRVRVLGRLGNRTATSPYRGHRAFPRESQPSGSILTLRRRAGGHSEPAVRRRSGVCVSPSLFDVPGGRGLPRHMQRPRRAVLRRRWSCPANATRHGVLCRTTSRSALVRGSRDARRLSVHRYLRNAANCRICEFCMPGGTTCNRRWSPCV
ncbi:hypothetical protein BD413DRAFT_173894 [Trametes elegans]|nr:hypothetical protein BD413DRAFT_173894 [Trametes elegans]